MSFSPIFHWTDPKIRVHVAHCVLALPMVLEPAGVWKPMSFCELLSTLRGIEAAVLLYQATCGRPRERRMLTRWIPTSAASTTRSDRLPMPPNGELGTTPGYSRTCR